MLSSLWLIAELSLKSELLAARDLISFQHIGNEQGLPQSTVNTIFQDSHGYMWIGTYDGLSRYDGYQFINFKNDPSNEFSISNNIVVSIIEDHQGYLWVGTAQNGVNRFDPETGNFERFVSKSDDFDSLSHSQVNVVFQDVKQRIWVGTDHGLNLFLPEKKAFAHFFNNPLDHNSLPPGSIVDIVGDGTGNLWVASNEMLSHFDIEQQRFSYFNKPNMPSQINTLYADTDASLWVGTRLDGLFHLKQGKNQFEHFLHDKRNDASLSFNDVRKVLRTENGDLWIATEEGGLNVRKKGDQRFHSFKRNSADPHSISINDIWSLFQDRSGLLWIGTAGGGVNTTQTFGTQFSRLTHSPYDQNSLSHEFVWDVEEDQEGDIWFATLNGLDRYDPKQDVFTHVSRFVTDKQLPIGNRIMAFTIDNLGNIWFGNQQGQLGVYSTKTKLSTLIKRENFPEGYVSYNRIRMIDKDRLGFIWVGTDDGLLKIDSSSQSIVSEYHFSEKGQLGDSTIRTMLQDYQGNIWFGTWNNGLQKYDSEFDRIVSYKNDPFDPNSLSNNTIRSLYIDNTGNLWVGTFNGLNRLSADAIISGENEFTSYLEKDGLPNSAVYGIAGDINGKLWLSTNNGLSRFDPAIETFENYSVDDGLPANEFNSNSVIRSTNGVIYFGSVNGVSIVSSNVSQQKDYQPDIVITSLSVVGKQLKPKGVIIDQKELELSYQQNDVAFEFASLDFRHADRNKFRYRLLPYNRDWTEVDFPNQAVFTNLDPGHYTFELKGTDSSGIWLEQSTRMKLIILPPLWQTWWAFLIYGIVVVGLITLYLIKHKETLQEQKSINEHLRKVDLLKDEFLANTSHELRTPLNGIIGIAESLKEGSAGLQNQKTINHLGLIIDGGKRLAQLVNDILDFKKLSHHTLVLQRRATDIQSVLNVVVSLLGPLAEKKSLTIVDQLPNDLPLIFADEDRVQQIFHNLIGNAIKYTSKGDIIISAQLNVNEIEICVADSGIGIEESKIEEIFQPFEQLDLPNEFIQKGTGLGLSVTRQLVEQHEGQIWANAKLGKGSKFYFTLPCWLENFHLEDDVEQPPEMVTYVPEEASRTARVANDGSKIVPIKNKGKILIADDDPVNLQVLTDLLQMNAYQVVSAKDGDEAARLGFSQNFDLVILDIMMPGMSGYQVTKELRKKFNAIELPILLLSARNQPGDVTAGFEVGANDYVTKPIERTVLLSRIKTMRLLGGLVEAKRQKQHANTLQQACERLGKYFPKQMVNQIITTSKENQLVAQRKQITVLFADLAGFTSVSDRFEPEAITDILNSFLGKMGELIEERNGVLNEILGDGLVVLFGAIDNMGKTEQAINAASLALKMQNAMSELSNQWLDAGFDHNVKLRIGIHQDFATVGNFGSKDIVAFRAVGSGVNFASRLESFSSAGEISVSYPIYAQCRELFEFSILEEVQFKGFNHKHRVCKLLSVKIPGANLENNE
ncbi:MAG: response regulator [Kangiellaceae bacterium]|nr:response regulator [Kangiellaceae bacterium]